MLTQLARVSETRHIEIDSIEMTVTPTFGSSGSILADTISNRLFAVDTAIAISSTAPRMEVAKAVATAERMCFMIDVIRTPHEVRNTVNLNGEPLV